MAASPTKAVVAVAGKELATTATVQNSVRVEVNGKELASVANANLAITEVSGKEKAAPLTG